MKTRVVLLTGVLLLGLVSMISGCARNTTSNVAELRTSGDGTILDKRIIINHRGFDKRVAIQGLDVRKAGDILQARVVLQNNKKKTIAFAYKFEWYGQDGFPIDTGTSVWKNEWVKGKDLKNLLGTAPSAKATDVRLLIQQVKK
ncbi:MAG TPA: YcfL family protein [bacterium]|nr:YcfL family protein [bacterium]